jgi:predicted transcriptional regulator
VTSFDYDVFGAEERERLHASIERGLADVQAGRTVSADQVIERLRGRASER